ncbi:heme NO-binding domain-containing protein, partial [Acetobacter fallax]
CARVISVQAILISSGYRKPMNHNPLKSLNSFSVRHSVNTIIHPEVMKLYSGACCPFFKFHEHPDGALEMTYKSSRKLLDLAHGFVLGAADLWGEAVSIERFPTGSPRENDMIIRWLAE